MLFDPGTLDIVSGTGSLDSTVSGTGTITAGQPDTTSSQTVSNTAIDGVTGNLLLQATTLLTVSAPIDLSGATHASQTLTLQSGGDLIVGSGGTITAQGDISLAASSSNLTGRSSSGTLTINAPVSTTQGTLALSAGTGGIGINAGLSAPILYLSSGGESPNPARPP